MPTYDANGNLTAMGSATYSYDARSLLATAEGPPEANPGPMTNILNITRDTRRRITRLQHNAQITYRIYDNWNLIAEYAPSGTLLKEHIHGTRIDEILLTLPASGSGTYHHHDALGNVVALTNAASYLVLETYTYDPFGKRTVYNATGQKIPDSAYANMQGYTGREHLPLRGLMDYRNRSYSTTLGRFLQTDPIRFDAGDVNLYRYVLNHVTSKTDSYGLCPCPCKSNTWIGTLYGGAGAIGAGAGYFYGNVQFAGQPDLNTNIGAFCGSLGFGGVGGSMPVTLTGACPDDLPGQQVAGNFTIGFGFSAFKKKFRTSRR